MTRIRPPLPEDTPQLVALAATSGLFSPEEMEVLIPKLQAAANDDTSLWLVAEDTALGGVVFAAPEIMSDRVWNVLMLMVAPERQQQGLGRRLLDALEERLKGAARLLLVETSSGDGLVAARALYPRCGYSEVARIPHYYGDRIDKIVFSKRLREAPA